MGVGNPDQPAWHVQQNRRSHEGCVKQALKRQGLEVFPARRVFPSRRRGQRLRARHCNSF
jgi:hypothetical protein